MNKKIKLIELLNMIANKENLPQKILLSDIVWYLVETEDGYYTYSASKDKKDWKAYINYRHNIIKRLNENVLILDEFEMGD